MRDKKIAIFSSCAGYGTYTPALALKGDLAAVGIAAELFVFETFFAEKQKAQFLTYRAQFHRDFRFAAIATGIASTTPPNTELPFLPEASFASNQYEKYIVLYGLWLPVLLQLGIETQKIICLQLDAAEAPSWRAVKDLRAACETIWMLGKDGTVPAYKLNGTASGVVNNTLVIHGGGWGITNYVDVLHKIQTKYDIHVIHSADRECSEGHHSYYTPINWLPDQKNPDNPPLYRYPDNTSANFYELCSKSAAIISKPGGGTCADCLRLHIPLVYLQGMAQHEEKNALHFQTLGYACSFQEWEATGFSMEKLDSMRHKITADMAAVPFISHHLK